MPFNSKVRSQHALNRPRDKNGHFISKNPQSVKVKSKISGSANIISSLFKKEELKDEDALVNLKVSNPLSRITKLLQDIKAKQATTVSLRFTIPLIALPIVFILAFQLGRAQTNCPKYDTSLVGKLKAITVYEPIELNFFQKTLNYLPFLANLNKPELTPKSKLILINSKNEATTIYGELPMDLLNLTDSEIIASGKYSFCEQTLTLTSAKNLKQY